MDAIVLVMETSFAIAAFIACILNLVLAEEVVDEETPELTANTVELELDNAEWDHIKHDGAAGGQNKGDEELEVLQDGVHANRERQASKGFVNVDVQGGRSDSGAGRWR